MPSLKLESLINRFPQEREAINRLQELLELEINSDSRPRAFSIKRLIDRIVPSSTTVFSKILSQLEDSGVLEKIVRIESPTTKVGIVEYSSILDVPPVIHDNSQDVEIEIKPENIKLLYRVKTMLDSNDK